MKKIILGMMVLSLGMMSLSAEPVCSKRVVSEITKDTKYLGSSDSLYTGLIKIQSVDGNIVKAWFLNIYTPAGRKDRLKNGSKYSKLGYEKHLEAFDLENDKSATLSSTKYSCGGDVISSYTVPKYSVEYDDIIPGTVGEGMMNAVREAL
jgi:hypothetical protein